MNLYFCENAPCGNINVYLLEGNKEKIRDYRMSKMSAVPQENGACCFTTNNPVCMMDMIDKKRLSSEVLLKSEQIPNMPYRFSKLESYGYNHFLFGSVSYRSLIEMYCNGGWDTSDTNLLHLYYPKLALEEYLLFHKNYETKDVPVDCFSKKTQRVYQIEGILSLPKPLYLLERILRGDAHEVIDEDIEEQLSLFTLHSEPKKSYSVEEIELMKKHFSILTFITEDKLKKDAKVLQKIRSLKEEG